ncbi:hypothetical protein [Fodinicola acaciae]|uniref:hypothetical protein n=1 Tax=Fodinicola acaciae TaxID=2681555 RepID=UPI0013D02F9A|nr:hypothetical protein [Fodinicola acaciae]
MRRTVAVIIAAATAALALSACGPTASKTGSAPAGQPKAAVAANPADAIAAAYDKTLAANTAKFSALLDTTISGNKISLTGDGSIQFNPLAGDSTLKGKGTDVHIITIGRDVYIQGTDKKWSKLDTSKTSGSSNNPVDYLGFLKGVTGPVTSTGTTDVHGSPATGYKVTVDFAKAVKNSPGGANSLLQSVQSGGITTAPIDIWLDNQGRLAQIKYRFDAKARGADLVSDGTVAFFDYGTPVTVTAPRVG